MAALQVSYSHSPYGNPASTTRSPEAEIYSIAPRSQLQNPFDFRPASPSTAYRWSGQPTSGQGESIVEERLMSNNGPAPGLPPPPGKRVSSVQATTPFSQDQLQASAQRQPFSPAQQSSASSSATSPSSMADPPASGTERRPSRSLGVHSMLNPSHAEDVDQKSRRRSAAQMEEPEGFSSAVLDPMTTGSSGGSVTGDPSYPLRGTLPRRILTPISPTLHRSASVGRIITGSVQTGTIDAQQSPFLSPTGSRIHTIEPGSAGVPQLPIPPGPQGVHRSALPVALAHTPPLLPQTRRGSLSLVQSARGSPSPSYSSYGPSAQASPAMQYVSSSGPTPPGSSGLVPSPITGIMTTLASGSLDIEHSSGIPVVSSGQNTYQLMAIPTGKGPVQIPVEMQAASRMADEKRKRNAGASARFRQRRKEKEREASSRISVLERQLGDAMEEAEWYKKERQELLIALQALPGGERYLPREKSPRSRRAEPAGPQSTSSQQSSYTFDRAGPSEQERNTRRKTESYTLPPPSVPSEQSQGPYPPTTYSTTYAPPGQPSQTFTSRAFSDPNHMAREPPYEREWSQRTAPPR